MKQEHGERNNSSTVPPMNIPNTLPNDAAALYGRLFSLGGGFTSQLLANHTISTMTRLGYPPQLLHPWAIPPNTTSPPVSPISPALSLKGTSKINHAQNSNNDLAINNNCITTNNNMKGRNPFETSTKKIKAKRKTNVVKNHMLSPPLPQLHPMSYQHMHHNSMDISGHDMSLGPISPPTSGSSPQSIGSAEHTTNTSTIAPMPNTTKDPTREKSFKCPICGRTFGYKHVLQNHERTHTGEKPFACPEPNCQKRFTRDHHLKTHMRLHTGEKPYHCDHCDRKFVQVANLRRHLRVHTGDRPYKCESCDAKFSDSNQLKAHILIHKDEKPFKCDTCQIRFRRRHHLGNHKCSLISPPTPAMSPAMSIGNKSASDNSEHSLDLSVPSSMYQNQCALLQVFAAAKVLNIEENVMPLDLSTDDAPDTIEKRNRKSYDVRRILRMPQQIVHIKSDIPVQTEPEDLSMHSPRSTSSISNVDDLDELDDAESLVGYHDH